MNSLALTLISSWLASSQVLGLSVSPCSSVVCRAGRECRVERGSPPACVCTETCPDHWNPVCGSDGVSYDNHCLLHRAACLTSSPVSPLHPGVCRERQGTGSLLEELSLWNDTEQQLYHSPVALPKACFENDRDRLREFLISWLDLSSGSREWYRDGMKRDEKLWGHFLSMDVTGDRHVDSEEMVEYFTTDLSHPTNHNLRQLCLDALVEEGDNDRDWRLSFQEFKQLLAGSFRPSVKVCVLNGKKYKDGAETVVECNGCVCACGKWICTAEKCPEKHHPDTLPRIESDDEEDEDEDEYDYEEELEPEDDPDVQDINWF